MPKPVENKEASITLNIGDWVWVLRGGKAEQLEITGKIRLEDGRAIVTFEECKDMWAKPQWMYVDNVYFTKEDLLKSL